MHASINMQRAIAIIVVLLLTPLLSEQPCHGFILSSIALL